MTRGRRAALGLLLLLPGLMATPAHAAECVVLLHGLGRSSLSMLRLEHALEADGYRVWNKGYPSTDQRVEELAAVVGRAVADCRTQQAAPVHFVTHSLGGILVRSWFADHDVPEARRIVMLGAPNQGSEVADSYRERWWYRRSTGPAGQQLGTGADELPKSLPPLPLEVGIIAGRRSSDPWFADRFAGAHDGKVSVESTRLPEMKDFLVVDNGHTFLMNSADVIRQVRAFLRTGSFEHPAPEASASRPR